MKTTPALKLTLFAVFSSVCLSGAVDAADADIPGPIAEKGELLFSDDFERAELGENWKTVIPAFSIAGGLLKGCQDREDHGAVGRTYVPMKDAIVEFKFKFAGSPRFNAVFDDKNHKGSHAGHICRVAVAPNQVRLGDDKEGIMRNDIFKMRRDPARKAEAAKLIEDRGVSIPVKMDPGEWHTMIIEISGDRMRVSLDGEGIGYLQSPGLDHPTKTSIHFTVNGKDMLFDDVRIWKTR